MPLLVMLPRAAAVGPGQHAAHLFLRSLSASLTPTLDSVSLCTQAQDGSSSITISSHSHLAKSCQPSSRGASTSIDDLQEEDSNPDRQAGARQRQTGAEAELTHVDSAGRASMVDIRGKADTHRYALASGKVYLGQTAYELVRDNQLRKGDVLTVAQLAGIMGAKQTSQLIPLCHNISLAKVTVSLQLSDSVPEILIRAEAHTCDKTGVEMEALTAVGVAALTVYDMCKAVTKNMEISSIRLDRKTGGKSGDYSRDRFQREELQRTSESG